MENNMKIFRKLPGQIERLKLFIKVDMTAVLHSFADPKYKSYLFQIVIFVYNTFQTWFSTVWTLLAEKAS